MVAGGSGISPFLAILSDIIHRSKEKKPCLPRHVLLVWAVKGSNELSIFSAIGMESICPFSTDELNIEIQTYVTQESEPSLVHLIVFCFLDDLYFIFFTFKITSSLHLTVANRRRRVNFTSLQALQFSLSPREEACQFWLVLEIRYGLEVM